MIATPLVVKAAGGDFEDLPPLRPGNAIDEAVLARNSASPPSGEVSFERLRLTDSLEGGSVGVFDHRVEPARDVPVSSEPVLIILPGFTRKAWVHLLCRVGAFVFDQLARTAQAFVQLTDGGERTRGVRRAAEQVHRFLPSGELFFGQNRDVAFSALARDLERLSIVRDAVEVSCHVLAQISEGYVGHGGRFRRFCRYLRTTNWSDSQRVSRGGRASV
jgi:hypothetical protein